MAIIEQKQVMVMDLPDGYYKDQLTKIATSTDVKVWVVAVEGCAKDWAAYCGFPSTLAEMRPEFHSSFAYYVGNVSHPSGVASNGDKFPADEAAILFPDIKLERGYRR